MAGSRSSKVFNGVEQQFSKLGSLILGTYNKDPTIWVLFEQVWPLLVAYTRSDFVAAAISQVRALACEPLAFTSSEVKNPNPSN